MAELLDANRTRGIYFVVNSGGNRAGQITRINAFFAEMDAGTLAEQHAKYDASPCPPSIRVETLKSVHGFNLAAPGAALEDFDETQRRLIHFYGSDRKIKDRSRVMRVPGFNHVQYHESGLLTFKPVVVSHFDPPRRYTAAEMLAAFPAAPAPKPKQPPRAKTLDELSGPYEAWKRELGARIVAHPTARLNGSGKWDCRGVCHDGRGDTGLFYDPAANFIWCNREPSCELSVIARAFGLAEYRGAA